MILPQYRTTFYSMISFGRVARGLLSETSPYELESVTSTLRGNDGAPEAEVGVRVRRSPHRAEM